MLIFLLSILITNSFSIEFVAHRAGIETAPENTVSAIKNAIYSSVAFIEIDVHLTSDGHVVVLHDQTVDRTTDGTGKVSSKTLKEIKSLDAGSKYHPKYAGEKIPTLKEVLELNFESSKLIIEIKNSYGRYLGIEKKVIEIVKEAASETEVIYKAFSPNSLKELYQLHPKAKLLYVTIGPVTDWLLIDDFIRFKSLFELDFVSYYQVHRFFVTKKLVEKIHKLGKKIIVWDVHTQREVKKFKRLGVDLIETDYPNRF